MAVKEIIGRKEEQDILQRKLASDRPELIAVYGRRRVGKTYLVRTYFGKVMAFEMTGMHGASMSDQLKNFSLALGQAIGSPAPLQPAENWLMAFEDLDRYLVAGLPPNKPHVLFFDEFPWIHSPKSNFLQAFDHWWNHSASRRSELKVVICGSAASWMIDQVINSRGGLHNRVTQTIRLLPFNLAETKTFLRRMGSGLDHYQVAQLYMAMGGVPFYLQHVLPGESAAQNIDRICFRKDGPLRSEFNNLYRSLFADSGSHEKIIRALARKGKGLNRNEIIRACGLTTGGKTTRVLRELEESGFITPYVPFGKMAYESIYKLSDEYSGFYLKFMDGQKMSGQGTWLRQFGTPAYTIWSGFAFESVCHKHVVQIKKALGIEGVTTEESGWRFQPPRGSGGTGAQIDLLLDRRDHCINICEMKFSIDRFVIDKKYAQELDRKVNVFRKETGTKKTLFPTMITTYGVEKNAYYADRVQGEVLLDDLFI